MYKNFLFFIFCSFSYSQIISYELVQTWTTNQVQQVYNNNGVPSEAGDVNFAVEGYKILYFTPDHNGELLLCSGAIYLPKNRIEQILTINNLIYKLKPLNSKNSLSNL